MKSQSLFEINKQPLLKIFQHLNTNQTFISIEQFARFCKDVKLFPDILSKLELQKILEVMQRNSEKSLKNQGIDFRSFEQSLQLVSKIGFSYKKDEDKARALFLHLYNTVQEKYGIQFAYNHDVSNFERVLSLSPNRFKARKSPTKILNPPRLEGSISTRAKNLNMDKIKWDFEKRIISGSQTAKMQSPQSSFYQSNESGVMKQKKSVRSNIPPKHKQSSQKYAKIRQNNGIQSPVSFQIIKQQGEIRQCNSACSYQNSPRNLTRMENTPPPGPNHFQFQNKKIGISKKNLLTKHSSPQSSTRLSNSARCTPSKTEDQNSQTSKLAQFEQIFSKFRFQLVTNSEKISKQIWQCKQLEQTGEYYKLTK